MQKANSTIRRRGFSGKSINTRLPLSGKVRSSMFKNNKGDRSKFNSPSCDLVWNYFTRLPSSKIRTTDLPYEKKAVGMCSVWAVSWCLVLFMVPFAYMYIGLIVIREICKNFPYCMYLAEEYLPWLGKIIQYYMIARSPKIVEIWCIVEAVFYFGSKIHIYWLQSLDPLEASFSASPMMKEEDRQVLWNRICETEKSNPTEFIRGWFFEQPIDKITKNDVRNFIAWCMFEGRNQEHLTSDEFKQSENFIFHLEEIITQYFVRLEREKERNDDGSNVTDETILKNNNTQNENNEKEKVKRRFAFHDEEIHKEDTSNSTEGFYYGGMLSKQYFFSNLYENYHKQYSEMYRNMVENADFHPVKDFRNFMEKSVGQAEASAKNMTESSLYKQFVEVEESAVATATQSMSHVYETLVQSGSSMDKQIKGLSSEMQMQLLEAWNSVKGMRERLETAQFLLVKRQRIQQKLKGYRTMLTQMRSMSAAVPPRQMASLMRRITECNIAMEKLEVRAKDAFVNATEYTKKNLSTSIHALSTNQKEPQRYSSYSTDPLLGIVTFPLYLHLAVLCASEIPLRIMMKNRGFKRYTVGSTTYYYHPGTNVNSEEKTSSLSKCSGSNSTGGGNCDSFDDQLYDDGYTNNNTDGDYEGVDKDHDDYIDFNNAINSNNLGYDNDDDGSQRTPIVFIHGIGIGLVVYMSLIDEFLKLGRPIILPEIPYVSGFRPLQKPSSVLSPADVSSTLTAILLLHGHNFGGTFVGHSYGTIWLSYMLKHAPSQVAAVIFLDPICFCLHYPFLTQQFVYKKPDPGTISYMVRGDITVNWTIQRCFPWTNIDLFVEEIPNNIPCSVILSQDDQLCPTPRVLAYLKKSANVPVAYFDDVNAPSPSSKNDKTNDTANFAGGEKGKLLNDDRDIILNKSHFFRRDPRRDHNINVTVLRDHGHGDWSDDTTGIYNVVISNAVSALTTRAEQEFNE